MIQINMDMPKTCGSCSFLMEVVGICAYCMATGHQIKMSETDLRDGMCPLEEVKK